MRARPTALVLAGLLLVAACGGGSGNDEEGAPREDRAPARATATIEHRYGTTRVEQRPERIVSLDMQWTDVLVALGAPPVGYILDPNVEHGSFPWRGDGLDHATGMRATDALPWEQIAALKPDLIVVTYFAQDEGDYQRLSAIAPTITTLSDRQVDTWQDIAVAAGTVLGEPERAAQLVTDTDEEIAAVAGAIPGLDGRTFALVNYVPGDSFTIVSDPKDGSVVLFEQLGLHISPTILDAGDGVSGRVEVSLERSELLDADLLLLLTNGGDEHDIVGYDTLPAVRKGAVTVLDYATASAINTPTPLSIPWALDRIRPALVAAAA